MSGSEERGGRLPARRHAREGIGLPVFFLESQLGVAAPANPRAWQLPAFLESFLASCRHPPVTYFCWFYPQKGWRAPTGMAQSPMVSPSLGIAARISLSGSSTRQHLQEHIFNGFFEVKCFNFPRGRGWHRAGQGRAGTALSQFAPYHEPRVPKSGLFPVFLPQSWKSSSSPLSLWFSKAKKTPKNEPHTGPAAPPHP